MNNGKLRGLLRRLASGAKNKKCTGWVILGLAGILLIGLTEWLPHGSRSAAADSPSETDVQAAEEALEERIGALLGQVDGVGGCRVMVTLERGTQFVYAGDTTHTGENDSERILTVQTDSGPVGLLITALQPAVRGVVVTCDGGGDPAVCERVTAVVSTAFNIPTRRVCVVRQQSQ